MSEGMRLAHISDLHVLALDNVGVRRFLNKRITGYANLRFRRSHVHRPALVRTILREMARQRVDHVAITGDLTNLALEQEFEAVRDMLQSELGLPPDAVSVVPGNHDFYTRGAERNARFIQYFGAYASSDLPVSSEPFPFVRLRGPLALVGLNTALARAPLIATGKVGNRQLSLLDEALARPELARKTVVVLGHHPVYNPTDDRKRLMTGLEDAGALGRSLRAVADGLFLHGHLHTRAHRTAETAGGHLQIIGATSASLEHEDEHRTAGFNVYRFLPNGFLACVEAHVVAHDGSFRVREIPRSPVVLEGSA